MRFLEQRVHYLLQREGIPYDILKATFSVGIGTVSDACERARALKEIKGENDFEALATAFKRIKNILEKYAGEYDKDIKRISTPAIDALMQYHWPGNVRELENCMERAVLLCDDQVIHAYHLPQTLQTAKDTGTQQSQSFKDAVERFERELLIDALKSSRGNMRQAAQELQTTERIFGYKARKYEINPKQYR